MRMANTRARVAADHGGVRTSLATLRRKTEKF